MRRLLFILAFLAISAATACGQVWLYTDAWLNADQGSGVITAQAYSVVADYYPGDFEVSYFTATVSGTLSPTGDVASFENNCGSGCATYTFQSQVPYLGATLLLNNYHEGSGYSQAIGSFFFDAFTNRTYLVPYAPSLTFTSVNAQNPNNVIWSIAVNGGGFPWQINFIMGPIFQITQGPSLLKPIRSNTGVGPPWRTLPA